MIRYVKQVTSEPLYDRSHWWPNRIRTGTLFRISLAHSLDQPISQDVTTTNEWKASICQEAMRTNRAIAIEIIWPSRIGTLDLLPKKETAA